MDWEQAKAEAERLQVEQQVELDAKLDAEAERQKIAAAKAEMTKDLRSSVWLLREEEDPLNTSQAIELAKSAAAIHYGHPNGVDGEWKEMRIDGFDLDRVWHPIKWYRIGDESLSRFYESKPGLYDKKPRDKRTRLVDVVLSMDDSGAYRYDVAPYNCVGVNSIHPPNAPVPSEWVQEHVYNYLIVKNDWPFKKDEETPIRQSLAGCLFFLVVFVAAVILTYVASISVVAFNPAIGEAALGAIMFCAPLFIFLGFWLSGRGIRRRRETAYRRELNKIPGSTEGRPEPLLENSRYPM